MISLFNDAYVHRCTIKMCDKLSSSSRFCTDGDATDSQHDDFKDYMNSDLIMIFITIPSNLYFILLGRR